MFGLLQRSRSGLLSSCDPSRALQLSRLRRLFLFFLGRQRCRKSSGCAVFNLRKCPSVKPREEQVTAEPTFSQFTAQEHLFMSKQLPNFSLACFSAGGKREIFRFAAKSAELDGGSALQQQDCRPADGSAPTFGLEECSEQRPNPSQVAPLNGEHMFAGENTL